jgi:hypothetical protein
VFILGISASASGNLTIFFYAHRLDLFIDHHPRFIQAGIKIRFLTGKPVTLVAKIDLLFLVTRAYPTVFKQLTLFVATPFTIFRGKIVQHFLEGRVLAENRVAQKCLESFGIDVEISQFFFKFQAVTPYVPVHMCKTSFATQAAGSYRLFDSFISHAFSPFIEIGYFSGRLNTPLHAV